MKPTAREWAFPQSRKLFLNQLQSKENRENNAFIENDFDALLVAKYYRDVLGYSVQVWKHGKDVTVMLDIGKTVTVKKFD